VTAVYLLLLAWGVLATIAAAAGWLRAMAEADYAQRMQHTLREREAEMGRTCDLQRRLYAAECQRETDAYTAETIQANLLKDVDRWRLRYDKARRRIETLEGREVTS